MLIPLNTFRNTQFSNDPINEYNYLFEIDNYVFEPNLLHLRFCINLAPIILCKMCFWSLDIAATDVCCSTNYKDFPN